MCDALTKLFFLLASLQTLYCVHSWSACESTSRHTRWICVSLDQWVIQWVIFNPQSPKNTNTHTQGKWRTEGKLNKLTRTHAPVHLNMRTPSCKHISPGQTFMTGRESFTCICVLAPHREHLETVLCAQLCVFLGTACKITCQTFRPDGGESGEHVSPSHKPDFFLFPSLFEVRGVWVNPTL